MSGFRKFILRGNLVDLAVAVVIGTQFSGLVNSFVRSFVTPLLALFGSSPSFTGLKFTVRKQTFTYGAFLTEVISFLIPAAVVYFLIVLPFARLLRLFERDAEATERDCPECTRSIPIKARGRPGGTAATPPAAGRGAPWGAPPSSPRGRVRPRRSRLLAEGDPPSGSDHDSALKPLRRRSRLTRDCHAFGPGACAGHGGRGVGGEERWCQPAVESQRKAVVPADRRRTHRGDPVRRRAGGERRSSAQGPARTARPA